MSAIQIIILFFILFVWWRIWQRWQKKELSLMEFIAWFLFWLAVGWLVLIPQATTYIANVLGVGRGADLVVYLALLVIFYLLFKIFMRLEKIERQLTQIVRELSWRNHDKPDAKDK